MARLEYGSKMWKLKEIFLGIGIYIGYALAAVLCLTGLAWLAFAWSGLEWVVHWLHL